MGERWLCNPWQNEEADSEHFDTLCTYHTPPKKSTQSGRGGIVPVTEIQATGIPQLNASPVRVETWMSVCIIGT